MGKWAKVPAARPDVLTSMPGTHRDGKKDVTPKAAHWHAHTINDSNSNNNNKVQKKKVSG